jgi:hypothetical protein
MAHQTHGGHAARVPPDNIVRPGSRPAAPATRRPSYQPLRGC